MNTTNAKQTTNLQDMFLNNARKSNIGVTVILTNGFQLKGFVKGFDNFIIMLVSDEKEMMIYKHAVSTIVPLTPILYAK
ncbi:RNA chaperone Hfq [Clostridium grantii]|uniref:RNA-binding protein Hfq n=1 Tax=Clostridium grantii DSM 8605 TaxID=1121316 RepID=A0A1M5VPB7_9CLOT|nr:RNA chaperone Hfq [Clostridium grantii]SHH77075.1 RNA-binding protein Hfq [Clostridium grantii DSM 8605]